MSDAKNTEIREIDLLPDVHKEVVKMYSYMKEKHPGRLWMAKLQMDHWDDICTAHERGKKLILTSTNTPAELIYAFDAVPFVPETLIMRYANSDKTFKYLDLADQYVSHQLCSINRGQIGYYLSGDLRMKPDAILATVTPCDSWQQAGYGQAQRDRRARQQGGKTSDCLLKTSSDHSLSPSRQPSGPQRDGRRHDGQPGRRGLPSGRI